ncbi:MAG: hypothetical protein WAM60_08260 [Candidatus Promineifilaceae bacterium]
MSKKSKIFLAMAGAAMFSSLVFRFAFATAGNDLSDFAIGLSVGLMVGVLLTWQNRHTPSA